MAIYVGDNKALMLKSDRSIAKLFKGDNVLFDYDAVAEGEIVTIDNAHSVEHKLGVKVGSKNIFDADTVLPSLTNENFPDWHWTKQEDGSFYLGNVGTLHGCKWFENTSGYTGQFSISLSSKVPDLDEEHESLYIIIKYTDGTTEAFYTYGSKSFVKQTLVSNANKTVSHIRQSYGDISPTYIKDIMIAYGTDTTYTPYMTDFSNVNVTRCGKNIFDADAVLPSLENPNLPYDVCKWIKQADGSFYMGNIGGLEGYKWFENTKGYNGQFSFSITTKANNGTGERGTLKITFVYADGSKESLGMRDMLDYTTYTFVTNANKTLSYIYQTYNSNASTYVKDIMITFGDDTEYEPYNPHTVTANIDGTVEGLTSLSPNMTILSDTDGVVINCEYVKG